MLNSRKELQIKKEYKIVTNIIKTGEKYFVTLTNLSIDRLKKLSLST